MKAIFNSRVIDTSKPLILSSNRAFCYGDGLFETIVTGSRRIDLIGSHLGRLKRGCQVLGIEFPTILTEAYLKSSINSLVEENNIQGDVRTKLMLWRNEGGLYSPESNSASFLIECKESKKSFYRSVEKVGVSVNQHTLLSPISFAKTMNALNYVLAGKEMSDNNWDEIILTDVNNNTSETHIANLFWITNEQIYTPLIGTGCIEGVMRQAILKIAEKSGITIKEIAQPVTALSEAESIFSSNASGITWFERLDDHRLKNPEEILQPILKRLLQP